MPTDNENLSPTLVEVREMRHEIGRLATAVAGLQKEVELMREDQRKTDGFAEKIGRLDERVNKIEGDLRSAGTERRWIIGLLVAVAVAIANIYFNHPH